MNEEMKFCINCGKKIPKEAEFCPFCGARQKPIGEPKEEPTEERNESPTAAIESANDADYRYNESQHPGMINSFKLYLVDAFTVSKRMGRADYWWSYLTVVIIQFIFSMILFGWLIAYPIMVINIDGSISINSGKFTLVALLSIPMAFLGIATFTSMIRRLHDTDHSGNFMWFLLLPIVGPIVLLVMTVLKSSKHGERFEKDSRTRQWYKKWWSWVLVLLLAVLYTFSLASISSADFSGLDYSQTPSTYRGDNDDTEDSQSSSAESSSEKSKDDTVTLADGTKVTIVDKLTYEPNTTDTSWHGSKLVVKKVNVIKTKPFKYDSGDSAYTAHGIIYLKYSYTPTLDVTPMDNEATISTNIGTQADIDSMDSETFDDIDSGVTKTAEAIFPMSKLDNVGSITTLRFKFPVSPQDTNSDDWKDYDLTINLDK